MLTNSLGQSFATETAIFPIITFLPDSVSFKCLGTGFFISQEGGFVTAKHIFFENDGSHVPTLFGVQTLENDERRVRTIVHFVTHKYADIAVGFLGPAIPLSQSTVPLAPAFSISTKPPKIGDHVRSYGYPLTQSSILDERLTRFTFKGQWSTGEIIDYYPEGASLLRNECYQTTMNIDFGASGGPVLKDHWVVGINSTGVYVEEGAMPLSFITPIHLINDMVVPSDHGEVTIGFIIENGGIHSDLHS